MVLKMDDSVQTGNMFLVYRDSEGELYSQLWSDVATEGGLVDPYTDEDMELIGWELPS